MNVHRELASTDAGQTRNSELVLAFVGPVGVDTDGLCNAATTRLKAWGYRPQVIKLSEFLDEMRKEGLLKTELKKRPEYDRIKTHMDAGDELRGLDLKDAGQLLACAAAARIAKERDRNEKGQPKPCPGRAWVISSLKNPAEVALLRRTYGSGFFLIGLFATEGQRRQELTRRGIQEEQVTELFKRDTESEQKHGQQTRKTFQLADAWVHDIPQLDRVIDLLFGAWQNTPADDEDGMALAYTAAMRSSELSRQVGAAIVSATGELLATGRNEVPAPGGGQYSPPTKDRPTARDCDVGADSNTVERLSIETRIVDEMLRLVDATSEGEQNIRERIEGILARCGLRDITEYGRAVHAELSALMSAARVGISVRGATLYCTTFPCHNCAKHIAAAGLTRVVYVEPYPKSKAINLHGDALDLVDEDFENEGEDAHKRRSLTEDRKAERTKLVPFLGIGPRRYFDLFSMNLGTGRDIERKDERGRVRRVEPDPSTVGTPRVRLAATFYLEEEILAAGLLDDARKLRQESET